jgi:hypothetical protein
MTAPLFTIRNTSVEKVALIHDDKLPWVIRHNGKYRTIVGPRYATQAEADQAALALNQGAGEEQSVR